MPTTVSHSTRSSSPLACPRCGGSLHGPSREENMRHCSTCATSFPFENGYWDLLPSNQRDSYLRDSRSYTHVRNSDVASSFSRSGSRRDRSLYGGFLNIWCRSSTRQQRKRNWKTFIRKVLARMEKRRQRPLRILDAGAGNGWAADRMAKRGHHLWAIDVNIDGDAGLSAHRRYSTNFTSIRASFHNLPFSDRTFDLILFNASIHYGKDPEKILREARRILDFGGEIVIMDTPFYPDEQSGRSMVEEKLQSLSRILDRPLPFEGMQHFLTYDQLHTTTRELNLVTEYVEPGLPLLEKIRRLWRRLRGAERNPASMPVTVLKRQLPVVYTQPATYAPIRHYKPLKVAWLYLLRTYVRFVHQYRYNRSATEHVAGFRLHIDREVFNPRLLQTGRFFARQLTRHPHLLEPGADVWDLGTGSGILALTAARRARRVIATDINPRAVRCAADNIAAHRREDIIEFREGDLFEPVRNQTFDLILFNPPYYRGTPSDPLDRAWRSEEMPERFARNVAKHLNKNGTILMLLSDHGEPEAFLWQLFEHGFQIEAIAHRDYVNEFITLYRITPQPT